MSVTIRDVAKASGVSSATVSRVLSGKKVVKQNTYDIVMKNVEALNYQPKQKKTIENSKIMVVCGDIKSHFYHKVITSAGGMLHKHGYKMAVFFSNYNPELEESHIKFAQRDNYTGIILLSAMETPELIKLLKKELCPVVLVNRYIRSLDLNVVCMDNYRGGYMATNYLIQKGHTYIAHLAGPNNSTTSQDRMRGYQKAMGDSGLPITDEAIFLGDLSHDSGYAFGEYFINNLMCKYTAVFSTNDAMTAGFIMKLFESGIRIPDDVSVICFDDSPIATEGHVKLTTVSRDSDTMGLVAAEMMIDMIENNNQTRRKVIYPPLLHERESVKSL